MTWLVDDAHLGRLLRHEGSARIGPDDRVATSGLWYVRLCQAVADEDSSGTLSTPFDHLALDHRERAIAQVLTLPPSIGVPSLRTLGPVIGNLRRRHAPLNLLAVEALAAAVHLDATVLLSTSAPRLEAALATEGLTCVVDGG